MLYDSYNIASSFDSPMQNFTAYKLHLKINQICAIALLVQLLTVYQFVCFLVHLQLQEVRSDIGLVKHSVLLSNSPGIEGYSLGIHNLVDVRSESNKVSRSRTFCVCDVLSFKQN